jgi:hypothetical protein
MEPRVARSEVTRPSGDDPHQRHASATHDPLDWHPIDGRHFANARPMADPPLAQIMSADRMHGAHQHGKHKVCRCRESVR